MVSLYPKDVTILAKGDAIIECKVVSYPAAQISWVKNDKKLSEHNRKFKIVYGPNVSFLRIRDASYSWQKSLNITCMAENNYGTAQASTSLTIIAGLFCLSCLPFVVAILQ